VGAINRVHGYWGTPNPQPLSRRGSRYASAQIGISLNVAAPRPSRKNTMSITLYAATVPTWLQILGAMPGLLGKAEDFCKDQGLVPEEFIQSRLTDDMLPFAYQVRATTTHSLGAIKALRAGLCNPDLSPPPTTIAALRDLIGETITTLEAIDPGEIDSYVGKDMRFEAGAFALDFLAENFMLSFANPNFFFHATTAYDILRVKGLQIGKRDFVGRPRLKA